MKRTFTLLLALLLAPLAPLRAADSPKLLPPGWDPALAGDIVMQRLVNTSAPRVKGAHDAEFVCVGDRAYIVAEANDVKASESPDWPFIYATMAIVNLKTLELEKVIEFAKSTQAFENETLPVGACFVPRIIQKDASTLRCYFTSEDPGKRESETWYRDFDLHRNAFATTIHKAKLKTAAGTFDFQPRYFHEDAAALGFKKPAKDHGLYLFDSFKRFDGRLYVALNNFIGKQNALALVHDDLATFEVLGHFNEPQSEQLSEASVNRLPDGIWMAICRNDKGNYHFTTSQDGKTWIPGRPMPHVPNGANSKPTFDKFGGVYYLGWQESTRIQGVGRSVFNVDISGDGVTWERKYRFETPKSFQYPTFHEHGGAIWLCVTQGDSDPSRKERIMFGKLENLGQFESQKGQKRIEWPSATEYADPGLATRDSGKNPLVTDPAIRHHGGVHPLDARSKRNSLVTDPAILNLSLEPPVVNTNPGPEYQDENREFAGAFYGIDRTPGGRLWAGWASGGDSEKAFMLLASSDDDGKTWSKPRVVIDPTDPPGVPGGRSAITGNVWTDPKGRLWVFFGQSLGYFDGRAGCWFIRCDYPDADQPVWTKPERIGEGIPLNKPIVLANGDWLLPVPLWERKHISPASAYRDTHRDLDSIRMANVYASSDEGKTWSRRGGVLIPKTNFDEHMIVELKDGRLWMMARTDYGIAETFSSDGGKTWSDPQPSKIQNVSSRFHLRRLASGNILLVKNGPIDRRLPSRSNLMAFLSKDEGKTWSKGIFLDERSDVSYPDGTESPDGTIYILYDCNRTQPQREIALVKFREEDFDKPGKVSRGDARKMGRQGTVVNRATGPQQPYHVPSTTKSDPKWTEQAMKDAKEDVHKVLFEGKPPNKMVVEPILREWADGSWTLLFMAGGMVEPAAENHIVVLRSTDQGKTWSAPEAFDTGLPCEGKTVGQCPTELFVDGNRGRLFVSTHSGDWRYDWQTWVIETTDAGKTWSKPVPAPGRLKEKTFVRNGIIARDGRYILPFQRYEGWPAGVPVPEDGIQPDESSFLNPRNGVMISSDGGKTWTEHGDIRLSPNDAYFGWAENTIAETADGRIVMLIRADGLGGVLYQATSDDGGKTWPDLAIPMGRSGTAAIHNPGSKVRLFGLGGNATALVHNPDTDKRRRMSLLLSFDGMPIFPFTWPYQRVLQEEGENPKIGISYPDGFVSKDGKWLHLVYDDSRRKLVYYRARLPDLPAAKDTKSAEKVKE